MKMGRDGKTIHLVIEPVDITELVSSRDQTGFRSPLSEGYRASSSVIRRGTRGPRERAEIVPY